MVKHNNIAVGLPAIDRPLAYGWLAGLFSAEITEDVFETYASTEGQELLNKLSFESTFKPVVAKIQHTVQEQEDYKSISLDLASSYAKFFLGVAGRHAAPPYESAYTSERGTLFQKPVGEMSAILQELDLSVVDKLKEPPDHIAIQLSVMADLGTRNASLDLEEADLIQLIKQQKEFITNHLLNWLPQFRDDCTRDNENSFYGVLSNATVAFIEKDRDWLEMVESDFQH